MDRQGSRRPRAPSVHSPLSAYLVPPGPGVTDAAPFTGWRREAVEGVEEGLRRLRPRDCHLAVNDEVGDALHPGPASPLLRRPDLFHPLGAFEHGCGHATVKPSMGGYV